MVGGVGCLMTFFSTASLYVSHFLLSGFYPGMEKRGVLGILFLLPRARTRARARDKACDISFCTVISPFTILRSPVRRQDRRKRGCQKLPEGQWRAAFYPRIIYPWDAKSSVSPSNAGYIY